MRRLTVLGVEVAALSVDETATTNPSPSHDGHRA